MIRVFIPGKNWILSLAELAAFLEARAIEFEVEVFSKAFFAVSFKNAGVDVAELGGIIKIGDVKANLATQTVKEAFLPKNKQAQTQIKSALLPREIVDSMFETPSSGKAVFGVSVYWDDSTLRPVAKVIQRFIGSAVKKELATLGKRANFMGFAKDREYPQLSHVEVLKKSMIENKAEVLFCAGKEQTFVAITRAVHNPFEFQKRDVGKPSQRKIFAIPPRLARIMINLASCTEGKVLLDPFCGVGTILQEAMLAKAKVVGVDINRWCVEAARRNLEWLKSEYSLENAEYRVLQGDVHRLSQKIGQEQVDCIATEPDLGPALRQVPTTPYAARIIGRLEPLYQGFLEEAFKVLRSDGRLVLVSPFVKTRSGKPVTMRIEDKAAEMGFKRVQLLQRGVFAENIVAPESLTTMTSFVDTDERHLIGREIHVFQK